MSIWKSVLLGAACGGGLGFYLGNQFMGNPKNIGSNKQIALYLAGCSEVGAVAGAIVGGAYGLAKRIGKVAIGAIAGGFFGLVVGGPSCVILTECAFDAPGLSATSWACVTGACSCIPATIGALAITGAMHAVQRNVTQRKCVFIFPKTGMERF